MAEREGLAAEYVYIQHIHTSPPGSYNGLTAPLDRLHATEVAPKKGDHRDISGGDIDLLPSYAPDQESISSEGEEPTDEERHTLRHVSDKLPWSAWLVAVVELCERFAFYGLSGPFQNYIQNDRHGAVPGALGAYSTSRYDQ
jgi:POT family proton-dependent oligopeptide transporter